MTPETLFPKKSIPENTPPELAAFNSPSYVNALATLDLASETYGDASLFNTAKAVRANRYLWQEYPELRGEYWQIGSSGQGDFWLLRRDGNICWYDHDLGEITPTAIDDFGITFEQFLELSCYLNQAWQALDADEYHFAVREHRQDFANALNRIAQGLFDRYPYSYFD